PASPSAPPLAAQPAARRSVMTVPLWKDPTRSTEQRVEALLGEMSLEEKAAQLGSYWKRPSLGDAEGFAPMQADFDEGRDPFEAAVDNGLGHLTRPYGSTALTVQEGVENLREMQRAVVAGSPHGIPAPAADALPAGSPAPRPPPLPPGAGGGPPPGPRGGGRGGGRARRGRARGRPPGGPPRGAGPGPALPRGPNG